MKHTEGDWAYTGATGLPDKHGVGTKVTRVFDGVPKEVVIPLAIIYNANTGCGAADARLMADAKAMLGPLERTLDGPVPLKEIAEMVGRHS